MTPTWQTSDGSVRLFLGDCLDVLPTLDGVDAVVTDPPFGIDYSSGHGSESWGDGAIEGDGNTVARDQALWLLANIPTLCFGSWRSDRPAGTRMVLVWDTLGALGMGDLRLPWKPAHQELYVLGDPNGFVGERGSDVIRHPPVQSMAKNGRVHPFEKPVGLIEILLERMSGRNVCDPFMGSGTTGVACVRTGRRFIGIEKEPKYFEIAVRRIEAELNRAPLFEQPPAIQRTLLEEAE